MRLNKTTRTLLIGANIWYFGEGMMGPLFAVFAEKVGGDILDITWAWATYLVITGMVYIVVGRLINNKPYQAKVMVAGYAMNAALTFCYLFVGSPWQLFMVQAGLGIAEAIGTPAWDALYARNLDEEMDAYAWGLSAGQSQIVTGLAFAAGGLITHFISFEALFVTMGTVQACAALVTARLLKDMPA
ncbi:MFS transporter [Sediminibacterium soli]|uniref:MFS transporter n=1 Tax=Sediminibacterium soli TaxID=2698829 RepID=UPI00137B6EEA|nr:MFS transporter [Sediminibacterium soli]NCI46094.1 MFS transporter [Sediminibacterium soli]